MQQAHEISSEFTISRYRNGIKLLRPEYPDRASHEHADGASSLSVAEVLRFPFNVFFHDTNHQIREINESCWMSSGFQSRQHGINHDIRLACVNDADALFAQRNRLALHDDFKTLHDGAAANPAAGAGQGD